MDTRLNYSQTIKKILHDYAEYYTQGGVSIKTLFDESQHSYMLLDIGWYDDKYIHNAPIHLEIINDKIWIQNDDTEEGIATDLLEAGVPKEHIVLGFKPKEVRPYTEFAAA
ncbi:MAG: XisI protein [Candidatus Parabeggiatoa sp. nov. 3]|mgnify:CR=1 FL=1|nr:MAG: XisI protein [Gammaproteobacteria bacterium]RKZ69738.1 MAG: XisI protein [Gammaproteobacteria bacterium]RKZ85593.1 MAG: XisI protein [Gammaproteobacteria bacterium]